MPARPAPPSPAHSCHRPQRIPSPSLEPPEGSGRRQSLHSRRPCEALPCGLNTRDPDFAGMASQSARANG